ncbi:MAG: T9SS type A sorting domain-containing protein, partial [Spirosomaceae bacterium]|nr:T9SS type A sorting domain-containing protein [Spirosomataceae bacterium]
NFVLEMSDSNGENFSEISDAVFSGSLVRFHLPNTLIASPNYQVRVVSKSPYLESTVSEKFTVHTKGVLKLSLSESVIRPNNSSTLFLDFTGSGPWEVAFENGIVLSGISNRRHQIRLKPQSTNSYKISSAVGLCGNVIVENAVTLTIAEPTIIVDAAFTGESCENSFFQIPVSGLKQFNGSSNYLVKLSNADTTFNVASNALANAIFVLSPKYFLAKSNVYDLTIEGTSAVEYSLPVKVEVRPKPSPPESNKDVSFCFNTTATPLKAIGTKLKWYTGQSTFVSASQLTPRTTQTGVFYYYISQTNDFGCESDRNEIKVQIREPATAAISGNNTIKFGDRTALAVKISGDAPWNFELSDGQVFTTPKPEIFPEVQPAETKTYTLVRAANACGEVFLTGSAKIVVLQPLANSRELIEEIKVFPNPAIDVLQFSISDIEFTNKPLTISLLNMLGQEVIQFKKERIRSGEEVNIKVNNLPTGIYLLKLSNDDHSVSKRIVIQK